MKKYIKNFIHFHKNHKPLPHRKLSFIGLLFAAVPAFIWLDMMYALFRENVIIPMYYSIPNGGYVTIMLSFPVIALFFATMGHLKTPKKQRDVGFAVMILSIMLVILMSLALSPLME